LKFKLENNQLYDKIDIVKLRNGQHMALARYNDYRDMIIFLEENDDVKKIVFDSRIKINP
jgi:hypothetical protein